MRYFMQLSYRGANYHGWQYQPHDISVQQVLEEKLAVLMRREVAVTGAGRTDAGVNAAMMVAHFDVDQEIADPERLVRGLNGLLPRDIAVQRVYRVADSLHARFDAIARTYKYFAHTSRSAFLDRVSWRCHPSLDFEAMNVAAALLPQYSDFTSFSKLHTDVKTNICRVTRAEWSRVDTNLDLPGFTGNRWVFTITADRFLRNMVRAIVGTLVDVGCHKITVEEFALIIERKDRGAAGTSMPGHALYLWHIAYP